MPRPLLRRANRLLACALLLCFVPGTTTAIDKLSIESGFEVIFNGTDLSGWQGDPKLWSVEDGAIVGRTSDQDPIEQNSFLIWQDGRVGDFELRAEFQLEGNNNSGIMYRSAPVPEAGEFVLAGYQADIHPKPSYLGMLYDERGRGIVAESGQQVRIKSDGSKDVQGEPISAATAQLGEWNELTIIAEGNRLTHKINGETTVTIIDLQEAESELEGLIGLQVHQGPEMTVRFRNIRLKRLETEAEAVRGRKAKAARLKMADGFEIESLYTVPAETQGSWVSMTVDPKGRLIVSDQYGKLYRVTVPGVGKAGEVSVEPINDDIGEAQGLLWAFDSLYVMVNTGGTFQSGLYRVLDTDGDDQLDTVEQLRALNGLGEHGPHAIIPSRDGESLFVICGNNTAITNFDATKVPAIWGEDHLLPRLPDGNGFMAGVLGPGGAIYQIDPDGEHWTLISTGYRNPYDLAFNRRGELFTYDADMEWDLNTPWYRPTRVNHAVSGSDYGWRNGAGKWMAYYPDSLPAAVDIGPGSPTGITFGYGAKFPAKYQDALYICDWSYGRLYAVHLEPEGASYTGTFEEFITGAPLALTDIVVNPVDGALYFAVGGRRTSSELYRVTYSGTESTEPVTDNDDVNASVVASDLRRSLEAFHGGPNPNAVEAAWPHLSHPDRFVRYAARVAIEFQPPAEWKELALGEEDPKSAALGLLALIRASVPDPDHHPEENAVVDRSLRDEVLEALDRFDWESLTTDQKLDFLRVYTVLFSRLGPPDDQTRASLVAKFGPKLPNDRRLVNADLCRLLVFLKDPEVASKGVALLEAAPTQEEQIDYARMLRVVENGWTPELRERYFQWFVKASGYRGGSSFGNFVRQIKADAIAGLTDEEKTALEPILTAKLEQPANAVPTIQRKFVKEWTFEELLPLLDDGLDRDRNYSVGRRLFAETQCFSCHRFDGEGGAMGPDLTGVAGRFSPRDLLESIIDPSKTISDQYEAVMIATSDGRLISGRIVNLNGNGFQINTDMLNPNAQVRVMRDNIEEMQPSPTSMMPAGLLNTMTEEEILDLLAYLLSRGNPDAAMFESE